MERIRDVLFDRKLSYDQAIEMTHREYIDDIFREEDGSTFEDDSLTEHGGVEITDQDVSTAQQESFMDEKQDRFSQSSKS